MSKLLRLNKILPTMKLSPSVKLKFIEAERIGIVSGFCEKLEAEVAEKLSVNLQRTWPKLDSVALYYHKKVKSKHQSELPGKSSTLREIFEILDEL